uniref:RING-type domain-containing protein n=1 Tax=Parastrongyloides trichosuri TaxID=131310 RepID=A0A0N4ZUM7_PARTI
MFTVDTSINSMQNKSFTSSYLKNSLFGPSCGSETTNEDGECLICLDRNPNTVLPCSHAFCEICIDRIKECNKNFCPLCREEIKKDGNEDLWSIPDLPEYSEIQNYMLSIVNDTNKDD